MRAFDPVRPPQPGGGDQAQLSAGVTRPNLSQSSGSTPPAGRNAGLHDARSRPGAECVVPPAGTALAPHNREHPRDGVPYRARFATEVTEMETNVNVMVTTSFRHFRGSPAIHAAFLLVPPLPTS
jgi:hypothetical protein